MESFDPLLIVINVGGNPVVGLGETLVTIARTDPMWNYQVGGQGDVCRVKTNNTMADVTFSLLQCSPSNDFFTLIANADESKNEGVTEIDVYYDSKLILQSFDASVEKKPDLSIANSPQEISWVFKCAHTPLYNVGNVSKLYLKYPKAKTEEAA
jgi:hypothetical protein